MSLAFRLARRDAVRSKRRTALIVTMAAIPAFGLTVVATLFRSESPTTDRTVERSFGRAEALVHGSEGEDVAAAVAALAPGARTVEVVRRWGPVKLPGDRVVTASVMSGPLGDPLLEGTYDLTSGRLPERRGEAFVDKALARRARLSLGDVVVTADRPLTIVGIGYSNEGGVVVAPGEDVGEGDEVGTTVYVDVPLTTEVVSRLSATELSVAWRHQQYDPPTPVDPAAVGTGVLTAGLAVLEAALLAGAAFAVGIRRRQRDFGLLGATGASPRQVRRFVVAHGVLIGLVAGLAGVAAGIPVAALALEVFEATGALQWPYGLRVVPLDLFGALVLGLVTGVVSAVVPALTTARRPVVEALAGRRGLRRSRPWTVAVGAAAIAAGGLLAAYGAVTDGLQGDDRGPVILAGTALVNLGAVACAGVLVGLVGRAAGLLPLPLRLAVRDAARSRARSGPAVAAVMAAVSGTVAVSVFLASDMARQREEYRPYLPPNAVLVSGRELSPTLANLVAQALPARAVIPVRWANQRPEDDDGALYVTKQIDASSFSMASVGLTDPALLRELGATEAAVAAARDGAVVAFDRSLLGADGTVELAVPSPTKMRTERVRGVFAGTELSGAGLPATFVPEDVAERLGANVTTMGWYVATTRPPTFDEVATARARVPSAYVAVEEGFRTDVGVVLLALVGAGAFVTVTATAVAVMLAASESRPDLATLAAVGAAPRLRRLLVGGQALVVAGLGSLLGLLAGLVPSVAIVAARPELDLALPLPALSATLLGVPTVAAVFAAAVTRSRLPLGRRLA